MNKDLIQRLRSGTCDEYSGDEDLKNEAADALERQQELLNFVHLSCERHGLVPNLASFNHKCPECEIERLTRERDEAIADLEAHAPGIEQWEAMVAERDRLRGATNE